jgi:hypothetical protein
MKTYQLALAAAVLMATSTLGVAEEWRLDPTSDHIYYYGPVAHAAAPAAKPAKRVARTQARGPEVPIDRTTDHVLYYGPVAR